MNQKFLDLAGLTAYDRMLKEWFKAGVVDISDDAIRALFITPTLYEAVDLGLPSGTKWATFNLGATKPEEYGDYYAWGELETKDVYNWENYKYTENILKYNSEDEMNILLPEDDISTKICGKGWCTPTYTDYKELIDNMKGYYVTSINGIKGIKFTSDTTGQSIFLPIAGFCSNDGLTAVQEYTEYMTSQANRNAYEDAGVLCITPSGTSFRCILSTQSRYKGLPVRPVYKG